MPVMGNYTDTTEASRGLFFCHLFSLHLSLHREPSCHESKLSQTKPVVFYVDAATTLPSARGQGPMRLERGTRVENARV